jgi:hypothetical protein
LKKDLGFQSVEKGFYKWVMMEVTKMVNIIIKNTKLKKKLVSIDVVDEFNKGAPKT